jgi:hypothetical protein
VHLVGYFIRRYLRLFHALSNTVKAVLRRMRIKMDNPLPNQIFSPTLTHHAVCTKALWTSRLHLDAKYFGFFWLCFAERYKKATCVCGIQISILTLKFCVLLTVHIVTILGK